MYGANFSGQPFYAQNYPNGIQFDATANSGYHAADGTYSWTHVVGTGSNQLLVVSVALLSVANSVTALTYNGVAMTKLRSDVSASTTVRTEIWYLDAPAVGSHSVSITLNTANVSGATSTSYNNVDQATPADAQNGGTDITGGGGGSSSISTTTVTNGAWLVDAIATADTAITPTNLQTARGNITGAVGSAGQSDKQPNVIGGTAVTMGWDNIAALTTWTMSTMALRPSVGANAFISSLTATLSFVGNITRFTTYPLVAATLSFVGSLTKTGKKTLAGTLSFTGAFTKTGEKALTGTLSFTGSIIRAISYPLTGTLSFVGSLTKRTARALTGSLSFIGTLTKMPKKVLSGAISFTSTFINNTSAIFTAALTFSGSLNKKTSRGLTATLSFIGSLSKLTSRAVAGTLSFVGTISKMGLKTLAGTLGFVGAISYWASRVYRTIVKSTNKPETVKTGDKVEEIKSGGTLEDVTTGTKNETVSTGQTDTTVTTSRKDTTV